ncbi:MAG: hypothetical protein ACTHJQ_26860 [Rhizobiaceae bacterium]|jgi:hypothetical protein
MNVRELHGDRRALTRVVRHPKPATAITWDVRCVQTDNETVSVEVNDGNGDRRFFFRSTDIPLRASPEAAISAIYLSACKAGADIRLAEPVDVIFAENMPRVATVLYAWADDYSPSQIIAERSYSPPSYAVARLMTFTGGVDSTFSLDMEPSVAEAFLNVAGFDYSVNNPIRVDVEARLRNLSIKAGSRLVVVDTDIRRFTDRYVDHTKINHASIFAAIGHLARDTYGHLLIPSSHPADMPAGSHFMLDPLWSSSALNVIHHGADTPRVEKIAHLSGRPEFHDSIKVCSNSKSAFLNCGICYKCVATMTTFHLCGVDSVCGAQADQLTAMRLILTPLNTSRSRRVAIENIRLAKHLGAKRMERLLRLNYLLAGNRIGWKIVKRVRKLLKL